MPDEGYSYKEVAGILLSDDLPNSLANIPARLTSVSNPCQLDFFEETDILNV